MTLYALEASFMFMTDHDPANPPMDQWLDAVYKHLGSLDAKDVFIASANRSMSFTLSLVVEEPEGLEIETVVKKGMGVMRTAFHACGAGTPDWPSSGEAMDRHGVTVSLTESSQKVLTH